MAVLTTDKLRNVALISHSGAGKTMLAEAMLHRAGVTSRMGSIEDGTTASDYEDEEVSRGISIQTSVLNCPWRGSKINIIDTPGFADFRGEVISGLHVADAAILVVAAPAGVEVGTMQMWDMAEERHLSRMVYVSKMNRENADFGRVMNTLTDKFGRSCVPVQIPLGSEASFSGVINLLDLSADIPAEEQERVNSAQERLVEAVAEVDDDLATKFLENEEISHEELLVGLKQGVLNGSIIPVLFGSSPFSIGSSEVLDAIIDFLPHPREVAPPVAKIQSTANNTDLPCDPGGPLAALVFKTTADPFVGKLSYFRVYSGVFMSDSHLWNVIKEESERIGQAFLLRGKSQEGVKSLVAGDIGAVSKLNSVVTGDTLCLKEQQVVLDRIEFPEPAYNMAVYPSSKADVDKMTSSLSRISEEDPSISISRNVDTLEVLMGGIGDTHLEVSIEKMKRKFGVEIELVTPRVPYMETISGVAKVEYRHKKQSGGHGQFGHVWLELEPLPRGTGFEFGNRIVGGVVPREYIPSVEKGCRSALMSGVVGGFPVIDLRATLVDGSFHTVDSSGVSFEIAGNQALTKGIQQANPVLLEPIMKASINVPESYTGEIIGDLNAKRGRIQGMFPGGPGITTIEAEIPQAEMLQYATVLRSQTQGLGTFTMVFDHYQSVPEHMVDRAVSISREQKEQSQSRL